MATIAPRNTIVWQPGFVHTKRDYGPFNGNESHTDTTTGNMLGFVSGTYVSAYVTSDRIRPTAYSTMSVSGTASSSNKYHNTFYKDVSSGERMVADMVNQVVRTVTSDPDYVVPIIMSVFATKCTGTLSLGPLQSYIDDCDNAFLERLENNQGEIGAVLVELGETVSYVTQTGLAIAQFAKAVATGRFNKAVKQLGITKKQWMRRNKRIDQSIAGRWLEWSFAVKPLIGDVSKFWGLYSDPLEALKLLSFSTRARKKFSKEYDNLYLRVNTTTIRGSCGTVSINGFVTTKAVWKIADHDVVARKALGLHAVTPALWEGVPFSWLVDYVVNVGSFLAALSATDGLTFVHGYRSQRVSQVVKINYKVDSSGGNTVVNLTHYKGQYGYEAYGRSVLKTWPKPKLKVVLPDIKLRQISYVAALASLLIKYKRKP